MAYDENITSRRSRACRPPACAVARKCGAITECCPNLPERSSGSRCFSPFTPMWRWRGSEPSSRAFGGGTVTGRSAPAAGRSSGGCGGMLRGPELNDPHGAVHTLPDAYGAIENW